MARVTRVEPLEEYRRDRALFEAVRVDRKLGTVIWPDGADIDPDVLYGTEESRRGPGSSGLIS